MSTARTVVARNVEDVRRRIALACDRAGRDPREVQIVAVAKGRPASDVLAAADAGITDVGENRARELRDKYREVGDAVRWHFVGNIQTNKVRYLDPASVVHSVDRIKEARALARRTAGQRDVFIEVNVAGEEQKHGIAPEDLPEVLDGVREFPSLRICGLMIVAPRAQNPQDVRWVFKEARRLRDRFQGPGETLEGLSMGMSEDFEVAIEEGATIVRIGRAIFREE